MRQTSGSSRGTKESPEDQHGFNRGHSAILNHRLYVANVGDSRIYLLRGQKAYPLTADHTWENEIVSSGKLGPMEAAKHPRRDQIVRSVGYEPKVNVDLGLWLHGGGERRPKPGPHKDYP